MDKLRKPMIICVTLVAFSMLLVVLHLYTNKTIKVGGNLNEETFSLIEGEYEIGFNYSSDHDFALAAFYESNGQKLPLFVTILPAAGEGYYSYALDLPISIRNNSIFFETVEDDIAITSLNIKSQRLPLVAILAFVIFVAYAIVIAKYCNRPDYLIYTSLMALLLEPVFLVSPWTLPVYYVVLICISYLIKISKLQIRTGAQVFALFFITSLAFMEFFTTSSPLFGSNTAFDPNVYYSVGAALAHGKDLYKEVFDQKGPIVSVVFLLGYLLSPGYFYGVWLIEAFSASVGMYFAYKISKYFSSDRMSILVGFGTLAIYLNDSYIISGATVEEFMVTIVLMAISTVMPYICKKSASNAEFEEKALFKTFVILGLLSSIAFYTKFNLSIAIVLGAFILWLSLIKNNFIKSACGYIVGFMITTLPIIMYFLLTGAVKAFYHCYFAFNLGYGDVSTFGDTISRIIKNLYEAFLNNRLITMLIILGLAVLTLSKKYLTNWGKIIILTVFVGLSVGQYSSVWIFPYHFMPMVSFAIIGLIVVCAFIENYVLSGENNPSNKRIESISAIELHSISIVFVLTLAFLNNTNINSSFLIDKDPLKQEVLAQQMDYYSQGSDYSFFELGFLESGVYQAAKKYPEVLYFFLPNIDVEINAEPYASQCSYIDNKATDYIIWRGFNDENVPIIEPIDINYDRVATYISKDDEYYMLYMKK